MLSQSQQSAEITYRESGRPNLIYASFIILTCWFSFSPLSGAVGATPAGALLLVFLLRRLQIVDVVFLSVFVILCLISSFSYFSPMELALVLIGPAIYLYLKDNMPDKMGRLLYFFSYLFLLDAVLGSLISQDIIRSISLLTKEPSHAARAFYSLLSILLFCRRKDTMHLSLLAIGFVVFNRSGTSLLFSIAFIVIANVHIFNLKNILKLLITSTALISCVYLLVTYFPDFRVSRIVTSVILESVFLNLGQVQALNVIGGPRLVLSMAAFDLGGWLGYGIGSSEAVFEQVASGTELDPFQIPYIAEFLRIVPSSYASQIVFEAGYIAFGVLLIWVFINRRAGRVNALFFWFGVFQLLFLSTTTMPTPWIYLALARWKW